MAFLFFNSLSSLSAHPNNKVLTLFEKNTSSSSSSSVVLCQGGIVKKTCLVVEKVKKPSNGIMVNVVKDLAGTTTTLVGEEEEEDNDGGIGIVNFLRGKAFFITGATGFLAKVLIEKILRTVPDVGKIYVMIKAEDKEAAFERLHTEIIDAELFKNLQQSYGKSYKAFMLSKLVPVVGNLSDIDLGLKADSNHLLVNDVDIIVNSAANTSFDERYDIAIDINTRGPSHLMRFAKKCKKLKVFVQVSTAYVNGQRKGRIWEKPFSMGDSIFEPTLDVQSEMDLAFNCKEASPDYVRQIGLQRARKYGWQDTYVFTKAMGEMVIDSMRGDIPVLIIRPSVIESTWKDPFPGWMEGNRMMDPVVLYYGKGLLSGFLADPNGILDVVPADMVVNATLAAVARHGSISKPDINVYQIASSVVNPLVMQDLARMISEHYNSSPYLDSKGRPIQVPSMKLFSSMEDFSSQLWSDTVRLRGLSPNGKLSRKHETICRKSVEQAKYLAKIYEPYTFYAGRFDNSNTERLMEIMSKEEKAEFGFDVGSIDWKDYIQNVHIPGLKRHVMKGRGMNTT